MCIDFHNIIFKRITSNFRRSYHAKMSLKLILHWDHFHFHNVLYHFVDFLNFLDFWQFSVKVDIDGLTMFLINKKINSSIFFLILSQHFLLSLFRLYKLLDYEKIWYCWNWWINVSGNYFYLWMRNLITIKSVRAIYSSFWFLKTYNSVINSFFSDFLSFQ